MISKTIAENIKILAFDDESLYRIENRSGWGQFALFLILCSLLESMPTSIDEISKVPFYFSTSIIKLSLISLIILEVGTLFGMKSKAENFLGAVLNLLFVATVLTTLLAYVSIILFQNLLGWTEAAQLIQSLLPFYTYALFAWGCEYSLKTSEMKGVLFAAFCLALIVVLSQIQIFFFQFY